MIEKEENEAIKSSIMRVVEDFQYSRYNFLYEIDLQASLFDKLFSSYNKMDKRILLKLNKQNYGYKFGYNKDTEISFNPVKCEYPYREIFDIAIIDEKSVKEINIDRDNTLWELPVKCAIEIKYCLLGYSPFVRFREFKKDILKLHAYKETSDFIGLALYFIQDNEEDPAFQKIKSELEIVTDDLVIDKGVTGYVFIENKKYKVKNNI